METNNSEQDAILSDLLRCIREGGRLTGMLAECVCRSLPSPTEAPLPPDFSLPQVSDEPRESARGWLRSAQAFLATSNDSLRRANLLIQIQDELSSIEMRLAREFKEFAENQDSQDSSR